MALPPFNLDEQAFNRSTHGMLQPRNIPMLVEEEEEEVVNFQIFQPPRVAVQGDRSEEDRLLELVMALAHDLHTFRDFESYLFDRSTKYESDSEDVPLDYDFED